MTSGGKREGAGRPSLPKDQKKKPVNLKLTPWVNDWLSDQSTPKAQLIEKAVIGYYGLKEPD